MMVEETLEAPLKRTPLYQAHLRRLAKTGPFGGWELPIYYTSILKEHEAVRQRAGLFDVSHLGHLNAVGTDVVDQLQKVVTQDLEVKLPIGRAVYTPMCSEQGFILDEMIFYHLAQGNIRLVVNASNGDKILEQLQTQLPDLWVQDFREKFGTLALQGPRALEILRKVGGAALAAAPRYTVNPGQVAGAAVWAARTGYTGEDGCELFVPSEQLETVWEAVLEAGAPLGIAPIGLGARDTLRLEAGLPLGGSDLDPQTTPLEAGMEWTIGWGKTDFIGLQALKQQKAQGVSRQLVGFKLMEQGIPRQGLSIFYQGVRVGQVTSGTFLPDLGNAIGLGFLRPEICVPGTEIQIEIRGRQVPAQVVKLPFYKRKK